MPKTSTQSLELGALAPDFALSDVDANIVRRDDIAHDKGLLVVFICNHCPYVKHIRNELARIGEEYQPRGIGVVAINSNDYSAYPDDSPAKMKQESAEVGYTFPYLIDESQEVAAAYGAACTPDPFVFDSDLRLVYRGQFDSTRPNSGKTATGEDLRRALDAVLDGKKPSEEQEPSVGCGIKWKPGNEPRFYLRT